MPRIVPRAVRGLGACRAVAVERAVRPRTALGEPEVEQLRAGLRQHDVAGLQVAMDDALPVRLVEGKGTGVSAIQPPHSRA